MILQALAAQQTVYAKAQCLAVGPAVGSFGTVRLLTKAGVLKVFRRQQKTNVHLAM
jgi:hypothetical protein